MYVHVFNFNNYNIAYTYAECPLTLPPIAFIGNRNASGSHWPESSYPNQQMISSEAVTSSLSSMSSTAAALAAVSWRQQLRLQRQQQLKQHQQQDQQDQQQIIHRTSLRQDIHFDFMQLFMKFKIVVEQLKKFRNVIYYSKI